MKTIKFSSDYLKLPRNSNGTQAVLIGVTTANLKYLKNATPQFIRYDTTKFDGTKYDFTFDGNAIILTFIHMNTGVPFTTIRRYTKEKYKYYKGLEWKTLMIEILQL
jgi:hypothetical protein